MFRSVWKVTANKGRNLEDSSLVLGSRGKGGMGWEGGTGKREGGGGVVVSTSRGLGVTWIYDLLTIQKFLNN